MQVLWVMRLKLRYHTEVNKRHFSRTSLELVQSEFLLVLKWLFFHLACPLKSPFKRQLSPSLLYLPIGQLKAVAGASHLDSLVWFKGPQALKAMASTRLRKGMLAWETNPKSTCRMGGQENLSLPQHFRGQTTPSSWDINSQQGADSRASQLL